MPAIRTAARAVHVVRIHCPVAPETMARLLTGEIGALADDRHAAAMMRAIETHTALGDFGRYRSVIEMAPGWEMFTPTSAAAPTLGSAGTRQVSPTIILTLHLPADTPAETIDAALAALLAAHPWETPVIELGEARMFQRG